MSEKVVFFGSGPVAARSLELLNNGFVVEAVITKSRPLHHKGNFPVLDTAKRLKLPFFTANSREELDDLFEKIPLSSRIGILVDFGIIISQRVINYFPLGIVNSHFSVLPEWRGADPITFAILSGQKETGVSLMLLVEAMDEGPLIGYGEQPLYGTETTPQLTERLILVSDALLSKLIPLYIENHKTVPQSVTGRKISYSRKLTKEDGLVDWAKSAEQLEREIRAYIEWPKSRTILGSQEVILTKAHTVPTIPVGRQPGDIDVNQKTGFLMVSTSSGSLCIDRLKPAGKKEMSAAEFLRGYRHLLKK